MRLLNSGFVVLGDPSKPKLSASESIKRKLFGQGQRGAMYVPQPTLLGQQVLYQDAAGTVPVTADGDPVGYMADLSGNGNHAAQSASAARPIYRTDGTLHWLEFDGVGGSLSTLNVPFSVTSSVSAFSAIRKLTDSSTGIVYESGPRASASGGAFYLTAPEGPAQRLGVATSDEAGQLAAGETSSDNYLSPISLVLSAKYRATAAIADDARSLRVNGQSIVLGNIVDETPLSGSFSDNNLYIGARNNASLYFNGRLFSLAIVADEVSAPGVDSAESYFANLAGVTL